ncbi:MAG TPA: hypothetical protein VEQ18_03210 [Candidatus Nitrosocosmicus sp.]|nr:hypothetical protein [Candidatus Nitrosocosmicus sp.]
MEDNSFGVLTVGSLRFTGDDFVFCAIEFTARNENTSKKQLAESINLVMILTPKKLIFG